MGRLRASLERRQAGGRRVILGLGTLFLLVLAVAALPTGTVAEQATNPAEPAAGGLDGGFAYSCALVPAAAVRCWGFNREGELGYGNTQTIGDNETPAGAGPINFGEGRTVKAFSSGSYHSCAILDDDTVRCWGLGANGQLGYGTGTPALPGPTMVENVGDDETPGSKPPVDLGGPAKAISAGGFHTCAVLMDGTVRCWGFAFQGQLGYGGAVPNSNPRVDALNIGDDEAPGSVGPVDLGGKKAKAITAGNLHTCVLLEDDTVRCWGNGANGQLGYGSQESIGDDETAGTAGSVSIGGTAKAISAGGAHTCVVLNGGDVRCWGFGGNGRLGYGNGSSVGDAPDRLPSSAGPVSLGAGRTATAISTGDAHTCAVLDDANVRCWGYNIDGRLGYGNKIDVGNLPTTLPGSASPVNLGGSRKAVSIALGTRHTCARLDDGATGFADASVRCWGYGANGRLGLCSESNVGDDETPGSRGPVDLGIPASGAPGCPPAPRPGAGGAAIPTPVAPGQSAPVRVDPVQAQKARARALKSCLRTAARHATREIRRARRLSRSRRARAKRHLRSHRSRLRRACLKRHGRTPGRVTGVKARATSRTTIVLRFKASGTDHAKPPAARTYVAKQSLRRIRGARGFRRAHSLCRGKCRFSAETTVGGRLTVKIVGLRPHTTYYYSVAARDNVSRRLGRRSRVVRATTR